MKNIIPVLHLLVYIFQDTISLDISMNSIEAPIGTSDVQLICSYEADSSENIQEIYINVFIEGVFGRVATFFPNNEYPPRFGLDGLYLSRRASLFNPTENSTSAIITIHMLSCIDEAEYQCEIRYDDNGTLPSPLPTTTSNITVTGYAEVPDTAPIMSPASEIQEGQNVTFTCSGIVGDPPGRFIWEKYRMIGFMPATYPDEPTLITENPGDCVYSGSSSVTITVGKDDDNAFVRCRVDQELSDSGLFRQTEPFRVYYSVRQTGIFRDPDLPLYDNSTTDVVLECYAAGYPTPAFTWYKDGEEYSTSAIITVKVYSINSGNYTCKTTNTFKGNVFEDSAATLVAIAPNITGPMDTRSSANIERPFAFMLVIYSVLVLLVTI